MRFDASNTLTSHFQADRRTSGGRPASSRFGPLAIGSVSRFLMSTADPLSTHIERTESRTTTGLMFRGSMSSNECQPFYGGMIMVLKCWMIMASM